MNRLNHYCTTYVYCSKTQCAQLTFVRIYVLSSCCYSLHFPFIYLGWKILIFGLIFDKNEVGRAHYQRRENRRQILFFSLCCKDEEERTNKHRKLQYCIISISIHTNLYRHRFLLNRFYIQFMSWICYKSL